MNLEKRPHRWGRIGLLLIVGIIEAALFMQLCSQREVYLKNGAIHETTWRYNSTISQVEDYVMVSTFDKITGTTTIQTFSLTKDKVIRTGIANEKRNTITVIGEDGEILYEGALTDVMKR